MVTGGNEMKRAKREKRRYLSMEYLYEGRTSLTPVVEDVARVFGISGEMREALLSAYKAGWNDGAKACLSYYGRK